MVRLLRPAGSEGAGHAAGHRRSGLDGRRERRRVPRSAPGRWEFATTKPLATYFVTLIAGPYHVVRDEHDGIPLAIYARRRSPPHLDAQAPEIFEITAACLDRYHELFGVRYPFGKYDQAFVPEFTDGRDGESGLRDLPRRLHLHLGRRPTPSASSGPASIAHEMAHMWFGDLVTMRWWDDLWLNESFAEYLGIGSPPRRPGSRDAWTSFAIGRKAWGYAADQRPSTHPVAGDGADADQALLNFDGISYAKGASVLRQLVAWLGDDAFLAGLRAHFAAHAYGNATLADLLDALGEASGRDLSEWAESGCVRPQVSTLRPESRSTATAGTRGRVQTAAPACHRPHRIDVATYALGDDGR